MKRKTFVTLITWIPLAAILAGAMSGCVVHEDHHDDHWHPHHDDTVIRVDH